MQLTRPSSVVADGHVRSAAAAARGEAMTKIRIAVQCRIRILMSPLRTFIRTAPVRNRTEVATGGALWKILVPVNEVQNSTVENFRLLPVGRMPAVLKYDSLCCRYPGRDHPHECRRQGRVGIRGR